MNAGGKPLAVSVGEPSGVGPDLILTSYCKRKSLNLPPFFVLADPDMLASRAKRLGLPVRLATIAAPFEAATVDGLPVMPLQHAHRDTPGITDTANAEGTIESIRRAAGYVLDGAASALVTAPIEKKALYDSGFDHPGHTEYLAALCAQRTNTPCQPVMLLTGPELSTVPITIHIPLRDVPDMLTAELIIETGRIVARHLRLDFGLEAPRLAFSGLNPHAGEQGSMGREDLEIVLPAIQALQAEQIDAVGPLPADTMFHAEARQRYDVALCMYHDQALIPVKTLGFDEAVNVTLGLPIIRTSPDHGTAATLAGTGTARISSFVAAMVLAGRMAKNRAENQHA